jgi:hypothetical protein
MSLDWSVTDMKNYDVLTTFVESTGNRKWHPVTETLIWATMSVGINDLTEKNWREFYERLHLKERVMGPSLRRHKHWNDEKNFITPTEVFMHIGLSTNASSKTKKQFLEDLYAHVEQRSKVPCFDAEETYKELDLANISEEEFQKSMKVKSFEQWDSIEAMVKRTKAGWTPEHEDAYLLATTENIGSTPDN